MRSLKLSNFRSYRGAEFSFDPKLTAIVGANGSGKTNILEAIYTLSMTKSFRGTPNVTAKNGSNWFFIEATLDKPKSTIKLTWKDGKKDLEINQTNTKAKDYLGCLPVVLFEPGSIDMITGPPQLRRSWIDRVLGFSDKKYLQALVHYRRVLKQRNSLLKQPGDPAKDQVFAWDVVLSEQAEYINQKRQELIEEINSHISDKYRQVAGTDDEITIEHKTTVKKDGYRDNLLQQLQDRLANDKRFGTTTTGPHRDDLVIKYNDKLLSRVGSRGENRTTTLALIQCELDYLKKHSKRPPILLLDDVLSELDTKRQQALLDSAIDVQTVITSTDLPSDIGDHATIKL